MKFTQLTWEKRLKDVQLQYSIPCSSEPILLLYVKNYGAYNYQFYRNKFCVALSHYKKVTPRWSTVSTAGIELEWSWGKSIHGNLYSTKYSNLPKFLFVIRGIGIIAQYLGLRANASIKNYLNYFKRSRQCINNCTAFPT